MTQPHMIGIVTINKNFVWRNRSPTPCLFPPTSFILGVNLTSKKIRDKCTTPTLSSKNIKPNTWHEDSGKNLDSANKGGF